MSSRSTKMRPFVVDGRDYEVSVGSKEDEYVRLQLTVRASYGTRAVCIFRGLRTFHYYRNYGYWESADYSEEAHTIQLTPRMIAALIRHALANGWSPDSSRTTHQIEITNLEAKALLDDDGG